MKYLAYLGLVLGVAACGDVVGARRPDAAGSTGSDAIGVDASLSGTANVITQSQVSGSGNTGDVVPNIQIISLRPNDTLEATAMTDTNGSGTIGIYPGGSVTAFYPHTGSGDVGADIVTYLDVEDGDKLTFGSNTQLSTTSTTVANVAFTWSAYAGASYYYVWIGCNEFYASAPASSIESQAISSNCVHGTSPFYAEIVAYDSNGAPLASTYNELFPPFSGAQTMNFFSLHTNPTLVMSATGLPAEVSSIYANVDLIASAGTDILGVSNSGATNSGAVQVSQAVVQGGDRLLGELTMYPKTNDLGRMIVLDGLASFASSWTIASPAFPPWVTNAIAPVAARQILWFPVQTPGTAAEQGVVVQYAWEKTTNVGGVPTNTIYRWTFIVPPGVTSISFPGGLPADLEALLPGSDDETSNPTVYMINVPSVTGYKGLKTLPERNLVCPQCAVEAGEVPRIIYSYPYFQEEG
jgi:hypothetical protein